jgi:hypothetical protein
MGAIAARAGFAALGVRGNTYAENAEEAFAAILLTTPVEFGE